MLLSLVLELKPLNENSLPLTIGNAVHGLFMNLVAEKKPELAEELHSNNKEKPFTTSPVFGNFSYAGRRAFLKKDEIYWIRFTSLNRGLTEFLFESSPSFIGKEITVLDQRFEVIRVCSKPNEHEWAAQSSYEEIYNRWVPVTEPVPRKVAMAFMTPTTFRRGIKNTPLPVPRLFFSHLAAKWNQFSSIHLGSTIADVIDERVSVSGLNLKTKMLQLGAHREIGFIGHCEFIIPVVTGDVWDRIFHALCDFAFYSGVGAKTTMGMGQVTKLNGQKANYL